MKSKLFVYGTLLKNLNNPWCKYLQQNAVFLGRAHLCGKLFDLGEYSGVVLDDTLQNKVYGDLFQLDRAHEIFRNLDQYEETGSGSRYPPEFIRKEIPVYTGFNEEQISWVYLYNLPVGGSNRIFSGDYLQYIKASQ